MTTSVSAYYQIIWKSLFFIKKDFKRLLMEIEQFEFLPKPINSDYSIEIQNFLQRTNTKEWAIRTKYSDQLDHMRVSIILFVSTLIEGLINEYHAIRSLNQADFNSLEKKPLMEKWTNHIELNPETVESLEELVSNRRKFLVHNHPHIIVDNEITIKGRVLPLPKDEAERLLSWCDLPAELLKQLIQGKSYDDSVLMRSFIVISEDYIRRLEEC